MVGNFGIELAHLEFRAAVFTAVKQLADLRGRAAARANIGLVRHVMPVDDIRFRRVKRHFHLLIARLPLLALDLTSPVAGIVIALADIMPIRPFSHVMALGHHPARRNMVTELCALFGDSFTLKPERIAHVLIAVGQLSLAAHRFIILFHEALVYILAVCLPFHLFLCHGFAPFPLFSSTIRQTDLLLLQKVRGSRSRCGCRPCNRGRTRCPFRQDSQSAAQAQRPRPARPCSPCCR